MTSSKGSVGHPTETAATAAAAAVLLSSLLAFLPSGHPFFHSCRLAFLRPPPLRPLSHVTHSRWQGHRPARPRTLGNSRRRASNATSPSASTPVRCPLNRHAGGFGRLFGSREGRERSLRFLSDETVSIEVSVVDRSELTSVEAMSVCCSAVRLF